MSFFKDADLFHRSLGGYGKPDQGEGVKADGRPRDLDEGIIASQMKRDVEEARLDADPMYGYIPTPIPRIDNLTNLARDIRLMPGTTSARFQQELLSIVPKWVPARQLFIRRIWQTLFVWSIHRWEESLKPPKESIISMERLSEAISQNGSPKLDTPSACATSTEA